MSYPIGWQQKVLTYVDTVAFYKDVASPRAIRCGLAEHQDGAFVDWSDGTQTVVTGADVQRICAAKGSTGVGLGMEDWAKSVTGVPTRDNISFQRSLNCMWCGDVYVTEQLLEEHEASCAG